MKTITTKYHGYTDTLPARVTATDIDGHKATVTVSSVDDTGPFNENVHDAAAIALCHKMRWDGPLMKGAVKGGYVYVFDAHSNRVRFKSDYAQERRTAAINVERAKLGQPLA